MNISVHIDRLVLDGIEVPHRQRPLLQAAVEAELIHLLAGGGVATGLLAGGSVDRVPGGAIHPAESNDPTDLGTQIAWAVHGGIGR